MGLNHRNLKLLSPVGYFESYFGHFHEQHVGPGWHILMWDIGPDNEVVKIVFNTRQDSRVRWREKEIIDYVWEISISNFTGHRTAEGLGVGSTEAEIRRIMGPPSKVVLTPRGDRALWYEAEGITFVIDGKPRNKFYQLVWEVMIYCPNQDRRNCATR